ncbi:glycosyltransferase family A protein [Bergeriella denitrificans]|uniref:Glycosyltransferase n=1 Tax=Bergeriella denitrificans TaxID=494 RepID=A0A378UE04_BERDE|nr:glycosyltransferase family A protein [Bergeriella denitrificans]STZ75606.1 glycosyltransferase [Bergeriella denitrificans]
MNPQPTLDVVIPCYNAAATLQEAVESALCQPEVGRIWLVDDGSQDETPQLMADLAARYPQVAAEYLPRNGGVALARNWGALQSGADFVAFLDADDAYERDALAAAYMALQQFDYVGLVRLALIPWGFPEHYTGHEAFNRGWLHLAMTVGGNMVFRRSVFLACGGFPQDDLFKRFGGEDGALGIAMIRSSVVGTLFDGGAPGVRHRYRAGIHAERLLDEVLFGRRPAALSPEHIGEAEAVTERICRRLAEVKAHAAFEQNGVMPVSPVYA